MDFSGQSAFFSRGCNGTDNHRFGGDAYGGIAGYPFAINVHHGEQVSRHNGSQEILASIKRF